MFRRSDNLIVTQAEHSRLSGELALVLGRFFGQPAERLAGAIALHDWPHFGTSQADTIEIGSKTVEQQRELVDRLSGDIPVDSFTELLMRWHWKMLSAREQNDSDQNEEGTLQLHSETNQRRIQELIEELRLTMDEMKRFADWTHLCDAFSFYLSSGKTSDENVSSLPNVDGDGAWEFHWSIQDNLLDVRRVRFGSLSESESDTVAAVDRETKTSKQGTWQSANLKPIETNLAMLVYSADGYPQQLLPAMKTIRCKFAP